MASVVDTNKRKHSHSSAPKGAKKSDSKRSKSVPDKAREGVTFIKKKATHSDKEKQKPMSKKELRIAAKEKTEARKKKRKPHYSLEKELVALWEKFRPGKQPYVPKKEKSTLVTEALNKMRGKMHEIATSHVSSRVLQACLRLCSEDERDAIYKELKPHLVALCSNVYAVHLVKKLLSCANKTQLEWFISSLHGHVATLLRHMVGSVAVEHAFQLGNGAQKRQLLLELYAPEFQKFKDLTLSNESRLVDVISKLKLQKSSVLQHMTLAIQPILEKGIVDHSIVHTVLVEYLSIAPESSAEEVIKQLSGSLLIRMTHTKNGSKVGTLCVKHGSSKERKKIIKAMKGLIDKIARDQYSCLVLISILSHVDDTKLLTKFVIRALQESLKGLLFDKFGRRPVLQLLHPQCQSYLSPDEIASLDSSIPSLYNLNEAGELVDGGRKDPALRREELLINSGLAESIVDTCIENTRELLLSHFGKDVVYEVSIGATDGILNVSLSEKLVKLHEAIATLAAVLKGESEEEHVFVNFHANRTIRKLILNCPAFATILWNSALKGKCEMWAESHSLKVVSAYIESADSDVKSLAKDELQSLVEKSNRLKVIDGKLVEDQIEVEAE